MISFDLETDRFDRGYLAPDPVCVGWAPGPHIALIEDAMPMIRSWFQGPELLVGTNLPFDLACLMSIDPDMRHDIFAKTIRGEVQCISINQKLIDLATRGSCEPAYSLEELCVRYKLPAVDKSGPWRLEFSRLRGVPVEYWPEGARDYLVADVDRPLTIARQQHEYDSGWAARTGGHRILHLAGFEAAKALAMYLMSCWGLHTSPERTRKFHAELVEHLEEAKKTLQMAGLVREDGSKDTKRAKAYMVKVWPGETPPKTKTGQISLDKEACASAGNELLELYSEYVQAGTLLARADDMMAGFELPLQTRFNPLLETGRTSSSKPKLPIRGFQAQNFPRKLGVRECLEPRPGMCFLFGDIPTAELRSLAQVCIDRFGSSVMADQINAGKDLHTWFAGVLLACEYEELLERVAAEDPKATEARQQAKPYNFGLPGGQGLESFRLFAWRNYRVRLDEATAARYKELWLQAFPEMRQFFRWISAMFGSFEHKKSHTLIRHLRSGRWRARVPYCAACNTQFQELTGMGAASGLIEVSRRCYTEPESALWNSRPVLYTHDELGLEVPIERGHEAAMELEDVMMAEFNKWHPDVPILKGQIKPVLTMVYSKKMKQIWREGRLVAA